MNNERRSREAVRSSIRSYGVKVMDSSASVPLRKNKKDLHGSFARFDERSLHSRYDLDKGMDKRKQNLLNQINF